MMRRLLLVLLCASFALGAPLAGAFAADSPCASAGEMPCDCDQPEMSSCPAACAVPACAAPAIHGGRSFLSAADQVSGAPPCRFSSHAGPPGLEPPR